MTASTSPEATEVLERALICLASGEATPLVGPSTVSWSERCVEVPWVAAHLRNIGRLLDVGWAMSPPEWLGVLLAAVDRGTSLTGIDIIDPQRVRTRYPSDMVDRVLAVPVRIGSILDAEPTDGRYAAITCVSTLEHIGFDVAADADDTTSAFKRAKSPEEALRMRDLNTDRLFLDAVCRHLEPGGSLFL